MSSLEIVSRDEQKISLKMRGISLQYANALRRICLNGVPVFAIDTLDIIENSSVLPDEGLAHRLALIPLKTDSVRFNEPDLCDCGNENGCSNCRVMMVLDSGESETTRTILSSELYSEDETVRPTSTEIPIVQLAPGQRVKVECYARLGRGTKHAKWNASNIATLVPGKADDEYLLTIETAGSLSPEQVVLAGVSEVSNRLVKLGETIHEMS